jgi:hypothetical protein
MRRITLWLECADDEAELLAKRANAYLSSLGALNVQIVKIEELQPPRTNK